MRIHPSLVNPRSGTTYHSMYLDNTMLPKQDIEFGNEPYNSNSRDNRFPSQTFARIFKHNQMCD